MSAVVFDALVSLSLTGCPAAAPLREHSEFICRIIPDSFRQVKGLGRLEGLPQGLSG
jgi:hypothetical protein